MPSFFIYSKDGDANFLAARLIREGHRAQVYIHEKHSKDVGRGIVPLTDNGTPRRGDIVIFDMVGFGKLADGFRKSGHQVIGGSRFADLLELNRSFGTKLMQTQGIPIPETHTFNSVEEGIAKLQSFEGEEWFLKTHGNHVASHTYGAENKEELERFMRYVGKEAGKFELQRKIKGDEISLEGWFSRDHWIYPFNGTIEDKKFMNGNVGPNTGCMANVVWAYDDPQTTLATRTLQRLTSVLTEVSYYGPIDLNMVIDSEGIPHGLEFSARFGYDALQALLMLVKGDLGTWLEEFSQSSTDRMNVLSNTFALTMNVSIPPFPNWEYARDYKGLPLNPRILMDPLRIFPRDLMIDKKGELVISGSDGCVMVIGDTGEDLLTLRNETLERIRSLRIPDAQYRTDPVERAENVFINLSTYGYEAPKAWRGKEPKTIPSTYTEPKGTGMSSGNNFRGDKGRKTATPTSYDAIPGTSDAPTF